MTLDTIELAPAIEDAFGITIPDERAEKLAAAGALHEFVLDEPIRLARKDVNREIVYDLIRNIICVQLGVKPGDVILSARFVQDLRAD